MAFVMRVATWSERYRFVWSLPVRSGSRSARTGPDSNSCRLSTRSPVARFAPTETWRLRRSETHLASPGSTRGRAPSLGLFQRSPLHQHPFERVHRTGRPVRARLYQQPDMFRLRGVSPPCRFAPPEGPRACCIPQPTMGFTTFHRWSESSFDVSCWIAPAFHSISLNIPRIPRSVRPWLPPWVTLRSLPSISAVPHHHAGRHWKALHDNASVRAFVGSPPRARARTSLRLQLPGLSTCRPGAVTFRSDHRSGLTERRPLSPLRAHLASPASCARLRIAPSPLTSCRVPLRVPARPQGLDP